MYRRPSGPSLPSRRSLVVVLVASLAFGVAAVLLSGTPPQPAPVSPTGSSSPWSLPAWVGVALAALVLLWFAYAVYRRLTSPGLTIPPQALVTLLALFLAGLLMVVLFHLVGSSIVPSTSRGTPPSSGSGGGQVNSTPPPPHGNTTGPVLPDVPRWVPYAILASAGAVAALFAIPFLLSLGARGDLPAAARRPPAAAQGAIVATLAALDRSGGDPRALIVQLYGRLLDGIGRSAGPLDSRTAREIERACLSMLGADPSTAHELTALFEEARYSTRPMGEEAVRRARRALSLTLSALSGSRRVP